ncbi:MAG: hypothetical protein M3198_15310 [Actinomycetota bacterium]|nr:hypothetical protein [Actinomycetota bacterium]
MTNSKLVDRAVLSLRQRLLELHKAVLDAERIELERKVGKLRAAEFLQVVLRHPRLGWLRPLTDLITRVDTAIADPEDEESARVLKGSFAGAGALITPPDAETAFGSRYLEILQDEPSVVLAHAATVRELRGANA